MFKPQAGASSEKVETRFFEKIMLQENVRATIDSIRSDCGSKPQRLDAPRRPRTSAAPQ